MAVKFSSCGQCGAIVAMADSEGQGPDNREMHEEWHRRQNERLAAEISAAVITKPGATLAVGFHRRINMAEAHMITTRLTERMPGVKIVLMDNVTDLAVYEAGEAPIIR